ncbi:MAG: hypothetical protein ACI9VR_002072 [Cognaticolwellia sp.]|jgi:hypothetical protein
MNFLILLAACRSQTSTPPIADAGFDQTVALGSTAYLDGTQSSDQDGFVTAYQWSLIAAPDGSNTSVPEDSGSTSFARDLQGTYTLSLVVEDDDGNTSTPDIVSVTASAGNGRPEAVLSTSSVVQVGAPILLDGSASYDPEGEALNFSFSVPIAPTASTSTLSQDSASSPAAEFIPDVEGVYVLGLEVDDGNSRSTRADLTLTVTSEGNKPPVADCGPNQAVEVGERVQLDGGTSIDPEGEALTYNWTLSPPDGSSASLSDPSASDPSFEADITGTFRAKLLVSDGALESSCSLRVDAGDVGNLPPNADAGRDEIYSLNETIPLDGSGTSDPEGAPLSVTWSFVSRPTGSALGTGDIQNADTLNAAFTPDKAGDWLLQLTACDEAPLCDTDSVQFSVTGGPGNNPPIADAGADLSRSVGASLSADASASTDPDGDSLSYTWALDSVPSDSARTTADLAGDDTPTPSLNLDVSGSYVLSVEVCDPSSACATDTMTMTAGSVSETAPVAEAGPDQTVALGATVLVDGSGCSDPNGDVLTYFWSFSSVPSGSAIAGTSYDDRRAISTSVVPDVTGTYTIKLRVDDASEKAFDTFTLTVSPTSGNTDPIAEAGLDQDLCGSDAVSLDGTGSSDPDGDALTYTWDFIHLCALGLGAGQQRHERSQHLHRQLRPGRRGDLLHPLDHRGLGRRL